MMRSVAKAKSEEMFMAACLLVIIGAGLVASLSGLSMALGAFVAGILLAETEYRHEVEVKIEPFKGLLLSLFFVSLGIRLDLSLLIASPIFVLAVAVGLITVKAAMVMGLGRLFGLSNRASIEAALTLAAGGEFAFVILDNAMAASVVSDQVGQAVLVAATLTMFLIPLLSGVGGRLAKKAAAPVTEAPDLVGLQSEEPAGRVLVVGYGRVGRLVGDMLDRHDLPWIAIDRDPGFVQQGRRNGHRVYFGDASRVELLERCGLDHAKAVVVTMDSPDAAEAVVATARGHRPDLTIVARARDARHAARLYELGATDAVPETIEASLQLSEAVLVDIGVPMGLVIASIHERRGRVPQGAEPPGRPGRPPQAAAGRGPELEAGASRAGDGFVQLGQQRARHRVVGRFGAERDAGLAKSGAGLGPTPQGVECQGLLQQAFGDLRLHVAIDGDGRGARRLGAHQDQAGVDRLQGRAGLARQALGAGDPDQSDAVMGLASGPRRRSSGIRRRP